MTHLDFVMLSYGVSGLIFLTLTLFSYRAYKKTNSLAKKLES